MANPRAGRKKVRLTTAVPLVTRGLLLQDPNNPGNLAFFAGFVAEPPQGN
jgi:hypothetical protein